MPGGASRWHLFPKRDDGDGRDGLYDIRGRCQNHRHHRHDRHGSGGKVNGAYLRVEIVVRQYNPNPLIFSHGKHSTAEG